KKFALLMLSIGLWLLGSVWYQSMNQPALSPFFLFPVVILHLVNAGIAFALVGPSAYGAILDAQSWQTDRAARIAGVEYENPSINANREGQHFYYGRIWQDKTWTVLQYHYFYAHNDYRTAAEGFNNHEADWEMVAVFLKGNKPYGVGYSQHLHGEFHLWND